MGELVRREARFRSKLAQASAIDDIPACALPTAPSEARTVEPDMKENRADALEHAAAAQLSESPSFESTNTTHPTVLTAAQRLERLRARIRAREAEKTSTRAKTISDLRRKLRLCEDAIALHTVVADLFARCASAKCERSNGIGGLFTSKACDQQNVVMTSEDAVISVASSQSPAIQPVQRMEPDAARDALIYLATHSKSWFTVSDGVFNKGARFLHRLFSGCAQTAMASLEAERCQIRSCLSKVLACGNDSEVSVAPVLASSLAVVGPAAPVPVSQKPQQAESKPTSKDKSLAEVHLKRSKIEPNGGEDVRLKPDVAPTAATARDELCGKGTRQEAAAESGCTVVPPANGVTTIRETSKSYSLREKKTKKAPEPTKAVTQKKVAAKKR